MAGRDKIRIIICDDQLSVAEGIAAALEKVKSGPAIKVVGIAAKLHDAKKLIAAGNPDMVIADLHFKFRTQGLSLIRDACSKGYKVVVLSGYYDQEDIYKAFRAGAIDYWLKDHDIKTLAHKLQAIYKGKTPQLGPDIQAALLQEVLKPGQRDKREQYNLTEKQLQALQLFMSGMARADMAKEFDCTTKTVKRWLDAAAAKLGVNSHVEAVIKAKEEGLIEETPSPQLKG